MGGSPRYRTWTADNWAGKAYTAGEILDARWRLEARCFRCGGAFKVRLARVVALRGRDFVLWGRSGECPRLNCPGRVVFFCDPAGYGPVMMKGVTAPARQR